MARKERTKFYIDRGRAGFCRHRHIDIYQSRPSSIIFWLILFLQLGLTHVDQNAIDTSNAKVRSTLHVCNVFTVTATLSPFGNNRNLLILRPKLDF